MTSTNTFQGMDASAKPSSRGLRPPGGGSSDLFGSGDDPASSVSRSNRMASTIFAPPEEPQCGPKRANPPGGKSSGIFEEAGAPVLQQRSVNPSGVSSHFFGESASNPPTLRSHPNKPKDNIGVNALPGPEIPSKEVRGYTSARSVPVKEDTVTCPKQEADPSPCQSAADNHEPRLGPRPRSHNKVIHPPGGKSSVAFY